MTNRAADIDEAARVVAEWLGWRQKNDGSWTKPFSPGSPYYRHADTAELHTYEGMGVVLEGLRAKGWHPQVGFGSTTGYCNISEEMDLEPFTHWECDHLPDAALLAASEAVKEAKDE